MLRMNLTNGILLFIFREVHYSGELNRIAAMDLEPNYLSVCLVGS